jgi:hypothetical protein
MRLIALDTLHVSALGPGNLTSGEEFEMNSHDGQLLIERGLAIEALGSHQTEVIRAAEKARPVSVSVTALEASETTETAERASISNKAGANTRTKGG